MLSTRQWELLCDELRLPPDSSFKDVIKKSRILKKNNTLYLLSLKLSALDAYKSDVIDTHMRDLIIGPGKEFLSKEHWMGDKVDEWIDEAKANLQ